jgi:hypothetical protein
MVRIIVTAERRHTMTDLVLSNRAQIARLATGESYSRSVRLDFDRLTVDTLRSETEKLRMMVKPNLVRAAAETNHAYTLETGEFRSKTGHIIVTAVVTRIN